MEKIKVCLQISADRTTASRAVTPSIHPGITAFSVFHINFYILIKYFFLSVTVSYINTDFS